MSETLYLAIRSSSFEAIKSGEQQFEHLLRDDYSNSLLVGKNYSRVVFTLGFPRTATSQNRIEADWQGYEIQEVTLPKWNNHPQSVYAIRTPNYKGQGDKLETTFDMFPEC